ncbi:MAG: hypothetical protein JSV62_11750 [Promethearchaeota archaeon]|nr:MAG: hypothetical protein JSV62_11750 [Candidatus Lokiarchaeota archaeon]
MLIKQKKVTILILFILFSSFLSYTTVSLNNLNSLSVNNEEFLLPKTSALRPLEYSEIEQNATEIYRLFESINFTIDTFEYDNVNYTKMQILFSNGTTKVFDMEFIGSNKFLGIYTPDYDAPLGFQNVSFLIYNETNGLENTHTTYTNFTILTNYMVNLYNSENLLTSEYYTEDLINAQLIVSNFKSYDFSWNTTIVDSEELNQNTILSLEKNLVQHNIYLDNKTYTDKNQYYYLQLNMTDKNSGRKENAYFPFYMRNNKPIINSSIELSTDELLRVEDCTISVNVTDIETLTENLITRVEVYDAEGQHVLSRALNFVSENLFSNTFTITANNPIGNYLINVSVRDEHDAVTSKTRFLTVTNNFPEIHSYTINGLSMNQTISVFYGRDLVFKFNVSDVEEVSYVKVALLGENSQWYNITREYNGPNTEITVRTIDLIEGIWYVYIYVIDSDDAITSLTDDYDRAPQGIRIIPDVISYYLPWILFFAGLSIGILVAIGVTYGYFKSKVAEPQKIITKKKEITPKKPITKKKVKSIPSKEEIDSEEIEGLKPKEEQKEGVPKRKIKRKL